MSRTVRPENRASTYASLPDSSPLPDPPEPRNPGAAASRFKPLLALAVVFFFLWQLGHGSPPRRAAHSHDDP